MVLFIENSPYLGGAPQYLKDEPGRQWIALSNRVTEILGYHLPLNEGVRTKADQLAKWNARQAYLAGRGPWAPVAAFPYTSNHDESNKGATDLGGPGGRAASAAEHAVVNEICADYGWAHDTVPGEPWHRDYVGNPRLVSSETVINLKPKTKTLSAAVITLIEGADTMAAPDLFHQVNVKIDAGEQAFIVDTDYNSLIVSGDEMKALEKAYGKKRVRINEFDRATVKKVREANIKQFRALLAGN